MKNPLKYIGNCIILNLIRIIFGGVFVLSGMMKIFTYADFIKAVRDFELLPTFIVPTFSYSMPILELILGLCLIFNFKPAIISNILTYLVAIFTAVVISKLIEGVQINCACFGNLSNSEITYSTAIRNILLFCYGIFLSAFYTTTAKKEIQNQQIGIIQLFRQNKKALLAVLKNSLAVTIFFFLSVQTIDPISSTKEYLGNNHCDFPVLISYDPKFKFDYKANITPQTIIVEAKGFIIKTYPRILDKYGINEIKELILTI